MRIIKEIPTSTSRITIFSWNGKYLIKFEEDDLEITYKIDEMDVISEGDLDDVLTDDFIKKTRETFKQMAKNLAEATSHL